MVRLTVYVYQFLIWRTATGWILQKIDLNVKPKIIIQGNNWRKENVRQHILMSRIEGKLLKRNCEFFKMRTLLRVEKYFQKLLGYVRNCRWALWASSVKQGKWYCRARTEFKLPAFAHFVYCKVPWQLSCSGVQ